MKKIVIMIFIIGIMISLIHRAKSSSTTHFENKSSTKKPLKHWAYPLIYAKRIISKGQPIPKGYIKSQVFNEGTPQEKVEYEKKIISGKNEYYNQFISGYEPEEKFTFKMKAMKPFNPLKETQAEYVTLRTSPQYQTFIKERLKQLDKIEKERAEMPHLSKKYLPQEKTSTPLFSPAEPTVFTAISNWLKSWWPSYSITTNSISITPNSSRE